MTTVKMLKMNPDDVIDLGDTDSWRIVRAGEKAPKKGDHGSWVETDHPAVVACMGSVPQCAENGCQLRLLVGGRDLQDWAKKIVADLREIYEHGQPEGLSAEQMVEIALLCVIHDNRDLQSDPPSGGADGGRESPA